MSLNPERVRHQIAQLHITNSLLAAQTVLLSNRLRDSLQQVSGCAELLSSLPEVSSNSRTGPFIKGILAASRNIQSALGLVRRRAHRATRSVDAISHRVFQGPETGIELLRWQLGHVQADNHELSCSAKELAPTIIKSIKQILSFAWFLAGSPVLAGNRPALGLVKQVVTHAETMREMLEDHQLGETPPIVAVASALPG